MLHFDILDSFCGRVRACAERGTGTLAFLCMLIVGFASGAWMSLPGAGIHFMQFECISGVIGWGCAQVLVRNSRAEFCEESSQGILVT